MCPSREVLAGVGPHSTPRGTPYPKAQALTPSGDPSCLVTLAFPFSSLGYRVCPWAKLLDLLSFVAKHSEMNG